MKISVSAYTPADAPAWDALVQAAPNSHFFFSRDYMDYHADRFRDESRCVWVDDRLSAVLPANVHERTVYSHQGLTYGGLVLAPGWTARLVLDAFDAICKTLRGIGAERLVYRALPHIHRRVVGEEDLFALHQLGARLVRRDLSSVLILSTSPRYTKGKRQNIEKAMRAGVRVERSNEVESFMTLLGGVLQSRHGVAPVHTAAEIALLKSRFPENIRLYTARAGGEVVAGALLFLNRDVAHTQYLANSDEGRGLGALDFLLDVIIRSELPGFRYLSFGISTEDGGTKLNGGLLHSKEAFGARGLVHDTYELPL